MSFLQENRIVPSEDDEILATFHFDKDSITISCTPQELEEQGYSYDPNMSRSGHVEYLEDHATPIKPIPEESELDIHDGERIEARYDEDADVSYNLIASHRWKRQMEDQVLRHMTMARGDGDAATKYAYWTLLIVCVNVLLTIVVGVLL